jgi:hypothetical protein
VAKAGSRARRGGRAIVACAALAILATSCVGPARTDHEYAGKAAHTADDVRMAVETDIVGIQAAHRFGLQSPYVSTLLAEADDDATAAQSTFASIQPPSTKSDRVRNLTTALVGDAVDLLDQVRITARRGHMARLQGSVADLERLATDLDELATKLRGPA